VDNGQKFVIGPGITIVQRGLAWFAEIETGREHIARDLQTTDYFEAVERALDLARNPKGREVVRWSKAFAAYYEEYAPLYQCKPSQSKTRGILNEFKRFLDKTAGDGDLPIAAVTRERIEAWIRSIMPTISPATVNSKLRILRAFLRWCVEKKWVAADPTRGIRRLKETKHDDKEHTLDEIARILKAGKKVGDTLVTDFFLLALNIGARPGEIANLHVEDVELKARVLHIRSRATYTIKDRADRRLKLNETALEVLQRRVEVVGDKPDAVLFPTRKGTPIYSSNLSHRFKEIARKAGVERATLYHCRHTFATRSAAHLPQLVLQQILGHSTPDLTARHYIHGAIDQAPAPPEVGGAAMAKPKA